MPLLTLATTFGIYGLMVFIVIAAIGTVTMRNMFRAALCLAGLLLGIAGIYLSLQAEFLAMVQILIYVGAVMTLLAFVIMLTEKLGGNAPDQSNRQRLPALAGILVFLVWITSIILNTPWPETSPDARKAVSTLDLGTALLGPYAFPFEVVSLVLLAALIGALVIARKDPPS